MRYALLLTLLVVSGCSISAQVDSPFDEEVSAEAVDHNFQVLEKRIKKLEQIQEVAVKSLGEVRNKLGMNE